MSPFADAQQHVTRLLDVNLSTSCWTRAQSAPTIAGSAAVQALGSPKDVQWTGDPCALTQILSFDTKYSGSILACHHLGP